MWTAKTVQIVTRLAVSSTESQRLYLERMQACAGNASESLYRHLWSGLYSCEESLRYIISAGPEIGDTHILGVCSGKF